MGIREKLYDLALRGRVEVANNGDLDVVGEIEGFTADDVSRARDDYHADLKTIRMAGLEAADSMPPDRDFGEYRITVDQGNK